MDQDKKICIVGSGLVGTLLAILLAEAGFTVDVWEKRSDPRKNFKARGRSIALSLSDRGWKALARAGLDKAVRAKSQPAYGRMVHQNNGDAPYAQPYGDGTQAIWTVNRHYLNTLLIEKAAATKRVTFFFEYFFESYDAKTGEAVFVHADDKDPIKKIYHRIIGADGTFSAVRKYFSEKHAWAFESSTLSFGYKELCIPPAGRKEYALDPNSVHIWHGKNSVYLAFPTTEGNFTGTFFLPLAGQNSLASLVNPQALKAFVQEEYKELISLMPGMADEFFHNAASTLTHAKGAPWHYKDKVLLIGDACHPITPFYGMGMNIGFEDCAVFMDLLKENNNDFEKIFELFEKARKPNTDAMLELSYKNLRSISESPDPEYQQKWALERRIWKLLPDIWKPTYVGIVFSATPLAEVAATKEKQDRIISELMAAHPGILSLSDEELKTLVAKFY